MKKINQILLGALCTTPLWAVTNPITLKFEEAEPFTLSLSQLNYNRIDVEGERIIKVSFPEGAFILDVSKSEDDPDDSVYLKPLAHIPLTVFFTTHKNHHFSVTVTPDEELGKTIRLVPKQLEGFDFVKQETEPYPVHDTMTTLMEGKVPEGFQEINITPASFRLRKHLKLTLVKQYKGLDTSAYVYRVENSSSQAIELTPSLFAHNNLMSLELSQKELAPRQVGYFYGLYREGQNTG